MDHSDAFVSITQEALRVLAMATAPILIPALLVGLLLGMVQAATSINEATLSFVPKLLILCLCLAVFGSMIGSAIGGFTLNIFEMIPMVVR
ncbi:MAG: flagellar biosynthetic protein FliQ [Sphingopyxis sp.]